MILLIALLQLGLVLAAKTEFHDFKPDIMFELSTFVEGNDVLNLSRTSRRVNELLPENVFDDGFILKFPTPPKYFKPSKLDKLWFNKFSTEEVNYETFWSTALKACESGVELLSCEGYTEYAAGLLVDLESQDEMTKALLMTNLSAIFSGLVRFKKYELILKLIMSENENGDVSYKFQSYFLGLKDGNALFERVFLCFEDEALRVNFMVTCLNSFLMPKISMFFMDYHPEMLLVLDENVSLGFFRLDTLGQMIFLYYRPEMDHELVLEFKMRLLEEYNFKFKDYFEIAVKYLHGDMILDGSVDPSRLAQMCEIAAIKGDWKTFKDLVNIDNSGPFLTQDYSRLFEVLSSNPEVIRDIILPSIDNNRAKLFKQSFEDKFLECSAADPLVMTLLNVYMEYYSSNPGVHCGVFIYPGIKVNDPDLGFIKYLMKEKEYILASINSDMRIAIINTITLIQTDPEILEKTVLDLINNGLVNEFGLSVYGLSVQGQLLWGISSFDCFMKLLGNPLILDHFPPYFYFLKKWNLKDYVKMLRYPKYFELIYPHRKDILSLIKNMTMQIFYHLLFLEEVERFLKFFDFAIPEFQIISSTPLEIQIQESKNNFYLIFKACQGRIEMSMKHLNSYFIVELLKQDEKNMRECERILSNWYSSKAREDIQARKRFFDIMRHAGCPTLKIKIRSLTPELFNEFRYSSDFYKFEFDLDAILANVEQMDQYERIILNNRLKNDPIVAAKIFNSEENIEKLAKSLKIKKQPIWADYD